MSDERFLCERLRQFGEAMGRDGKPASRELLLSAAAKIDALRAERDSLAAQLAALGEPVAWAAGPLMYGDALVCPTIFEKQPIREGDDWKRGACGMFAVLPDAMTLGLKPGECRPVYLGAALTPPEPPLEPVYRSDVLTVYERGKRFASVYVVEKRWDWDGRSRCAEVQEHESGSAFSREAAERAAIAWVMGKPQ